MTFYRVLRFWGTPIMRIFWPTKIINKDNYDKIEGGLVICNHYSKVDALIPTTAMFKDELNVLAKAEAFDCAPIANWFLRKVGGIPVHRGEPDIVAVKAVLKVLKANKKLLIFPEGTRNKAGTKDMGVFKDGTARFAIKTKKPILPMMYYGSPKVLKQNYLYVGEPFTLEQFYGAKTQEDFKKATDYVLQKMLETRKLCDEYVEKK